MKTWLCPTVQSVIILRWVCPYLLQLLNKPLYTLTSLTVLCCSCKKPFSYNVQISFLHFLNLQKTQNHFFAESVIIQLTLTAIAVTLAAYCCKVIHCCAPVPKMVTHYQWLYIVTQASSFWLLYTASCAFLIFFSFSRWSRYKQSQPNPEDTCYMFTTAQIYIYTAYITDNISW